MENKQGLPQDLQPWLQLTYEIEKKYLNQKKESVQKTLQQAQELVRREGFCKEGTHSYIL